MRQLCCIYRFLVDEEFLSAVYFGEVEPYPSDVDELVVCQGKGSFGKDSSPCDGRVALAQNTQIHFFIVCLFVWDVFGGSHVCVVSRHQK